MFRSLIGAQMRNPLRRNFLAVLSIFIGLATVRAEPPAASPTKTRAAGNTVLARFEGGVITRADMERAIARKIPIVRREIMATPDSRAAFLREMIAWDLLANEAKRRGYAEHAAVVTATRQAAIDAMVERDFVVDPDGIAVADVERTFQEKRASYSRPRMRRASHVQVATEAEARTLIAELGAADRNEFARVAVQRSTDTRTRKQGGELGWFAQRGDVPGWSEGADVPPELVAAAFAAEQTMGVVPQPVRYGDGFSVLMVTGEIAASDRTLKQVEGRIRGELARAHGNAALAGLREKLASTTKPAVAAPELLGAVTLDTRPLDIPSGFPAAPPDPRAPSKIAPPEDDF